MTTAEPRPARAPFEYRGPEDWMENAACTGYDPEWWFADLLDLESQENRRKAFAICATCPVRLKCLDYAMEVEQGFNRHGIYGGMGSRARRRLEQAAS